MPDKKVAAREAKHGKKMIEVSLRFWTNDISSEEGEIIPKHAWKRIVSVLDGRITGESRG